MPGRNRAPWIMFLRRIKLRHFGAFFFLSLPSLARIGYLSLLRAKFRLSLNFIAPILDSTGNGP